MKPRLAHRHPPELPSPPGLKSSSPLCRRPTPSLIAGDIGEAHDVAAHLRALAKLGARSTSSSATTTSTAGSIAGVRAEVRLCLELPEPALDARRRRRPAHRRRPA